MSIDVQQYLNAQFKGENAVKRTPIPVGEYKSVVGDVVLEAFPGKKDPSKTYLRCTVSHQLDDAGLRESLKREKVIIIQDFLVDLTESGDIDFGPDRNIKLGRLRAALGLNSPLEPWSFPMFKGRVCMVKVGHELYEGEPQSRVFNTTKLPA
jgi:hypothetical protein